MDALKQYMQQAAPAEKFTWDNVADVLGAYRRLTCEVAPTDFAIFAKDGLAVLRNIAGLLERCLENQEVLPEGDLKNGEALAMMLVKIESVCGLAECGPTLLGKECETFFALANLVIPAAPQAYIFPFLARLSSTITLHHSYVRCTHANYVVSLSFT